ncbi:hypothetical protein F8S13_02800 [Chloroflexia bacterium SDU3-3]|nr:hypothetical protein F8S13_02800 [Chloroflexia bacterium SDU3-3]
MTVLNTNDSGVGSLRQAIADAAAGDTIIFDPSLSGATIRLQNLTDSLTINKDLTIDGSALAAKITISGDTDNNGDGDIRVLVIDSATVTLKGLAIAKGNIAAAGGGISNSGALTLVDCTVSENTSSADKGGGIASTGPLTLINSTVSHNQSDQQGGGIASYAGALSITDSTIADNTVAFSDGGGIWIGPGNADTIAITRSTIADNMALGAGGGIYNDASPKLTIADSSISGNTATGAQGGGIYGSVTLRGSAVVGNQTLASSGGGLHTWNASIADSTIADNSAAGDGGGIYLRDNRTLYISGSTLSGNQAGVSSYGGAILSRPGATTTVVNSTISGNAAGYGGGIQSAAGGSVSLSSVTMAGNQSPNVGGIGGLANQGTLSMVNTIIASSTNGNCANIGAGSISTNQANLVQDGSCGTATPVDPMLGPLADNGGPTKTHALLVGSPAIDAGDAAYCAAEPGAANRDQRGVARPIDGDTTPGAICDIGAFEAPLDPSVPTVQFSQATFSAAEGDGTSHVITLTRSGSLAAASQVWVSIGGGTATSGADYSGADFPMTISFGSGESSQTVSIGLIDDDDIEPAETIKLMVTSLSNAKIGAQGSATLQIGDNDSIPSFTSYLPLITR